jgi:hypothetical protein
MSQGNSPLEGGACLDLDYRVVDKYFQANGTTERFQFLTAQAICGNCEVQLECLIDAVTSPPSAGIRGGESTTSIELMRRDVSTGRAEAEELALRAIARQRPLAVLRASRFLRKGEGPDVPPAVPDSAPAKNSGNQRERRQRA